jgi:hypothetical protein
MRLFSEEVTPTLTNSNLNIITVKDFNEVFFDVYELEINGKKYVAEKVSEYKGSPVVEIPITHNGRSYSAPFVVNRGKFNILYNESNSTYLGDVEDSSDEIVLENEIIEEVEDIIIENKETILEDIHNAKLSAKRYLDELKKQQLEEINDYQISKRKEFNAELKVVKEGLVEEFVRIASNVKSDIADNNDDIANDLRDLIDRHVTKLTESVDGNFNLQKEELEVYINEKVNSIASDIITTVVTSEIKAGNTKLDENIDGLYNHINLKLTELVNEHKSLTEAKLQDIVEDVDNKIVAIEKTTVELNDVITKNTNRALSRIGNVKTHLEESITKNVSLLQNDIETASDRIRDFYDKELNKLNESFDQLNDTTKQDCIKLISESKDSLLKVISEIKVDVPNMVPVKRLI